MLLSTDRERPEEEQELQGELTAVISEEIEAGEPGEVFEEISEEVSVEITGDGLPEEPEFPDTVEVFPEDDAEFPDHVPEEPETAGELTEEGSYPEKAEDSETDGSALVRVVGVRFRGAGKVYYFDPADLTVNRGDHVIVETARGIEYGYAAGGIMEVEYRKLTPPLRRVLRIATNDDMERNAANRAREKNALRICRQKIADRGLEMKLIDAEYTFDNSKVLFYFTAEGRVDFRELVKDLAGVFHTRIELRQIGVRDETRILGGYGICGRPLCCHTWLNDFVPVSIKMAKEQNLSLNPGKISGVCGRLMCCLKNETETYEELNKNLPRPGDEVEGRDGLQGQVESVNVLRQTVRILVEVNDEKEFHEYGVEDIRIVRRRRKGMSRRPAAEPAKQEKKGGRQEKTDRGAQKSDRGAARQERQERKAPKEEQKPVRDPEEKQPGEGRRPRKHRKRENKEQ